MKWLTRFHAPPRTTDARVVTPNWSPGRATVGLCHTIAVSMARPAAADTPELCVVVPSLGRPSAAETVASILRSASVASADVEVVLVWQAAGPAPALPAGGQVVRILPAGASHARNVGVARSRAERLAFVDDDVVTQPSWAGGVLAAFEEGADAACGPVQSPAGRTATGDEPGRPVARWYRGPIARPWSLGDRRHFAVRRRLFDAVGGFDVRMGPGTFGRSAEVTELIARLLAFGASLRWRPDMTVGTLAASPEERTASARRAGFGVGRMVRRQRAAAMAGAYALDLGRGLVRATRAGDRPGIRDLSTAGRGLVTGLATGDRWTSPSSALDRLPGGVRDALEGRRLHPWPVPHRSPPHFMWAAGADLVLHLYTAASGGFSAGRAARTAATAAGVVGVPSLVEVVGDEDAAWVLEERMPGRRRGHRSWSAAADWAVDLARAAGPPLGDTPWWAAADARTGALDRLATLPAVVVHGDLQAKNVLLDGGGAVSVVDWEQATAAGPPGYDLLFLTVSAQPDEAARRAALVDLAAGRDVRRTPVLSRLRAAGLDDRNLPAAIEVAVHDWAARERARRCALGMPPQPACFAPLAETSAYSDS